MGLAQNRIAALMLLDNLVAFPVKRVVPQVMMGDVMVLLDVVGMPLGLINGDLLGLDIGPGTEDLHDIKLGLLNGHLKGGQVLLEKVAR